EWNWVVPYKQIIDAAQAGQPHPNFVRGGLKEGFVKSSAYGSAVAEPARKQAESVRALMLADRFDIFKGELKDNTGKVQIPAGKVYKQTDVALEGMNYLVDGVVGKV
ncbi:MAG: BMP family ABC transporter substrate-binding protein, partial [Betaproteobacteria bacterium]